MQSVASINPQVALDHQKQRGALNETLGRVLNRVFGCWQHKLSLPFSNNGRTYRICVNCGMSRDFDPASWTTHGHYRVTGPNVIYPKLHALRPGLTNRQPSCYTAQTTPKLPQLVNSLGQ
jgi:hypothetical protein